MKCSCPYGTYEHVEVLEFEAEESGAGLDYDCNYASFSLFIN